MKKFLFITTVMLFTIFNISFANTPCCNNKMNHCTKCAKSCTRPTCLDNCSKSCKASGDCNKTCGK
ncbi:hypothetical protein ABIC45_003602 [Mucilaginibacter rubeus]|uniref:hypothetical protein n=1 Tax=Mucilaginibacter TaxID=423349 RepID=UPI001113BA62|nr:hypothetical protein [Mucilaginibacter sp. NFR10]